MARYSAPRTVGLDFEQWPQSVQQAWTKALEPGDVFSDGAIDGYLDLKREEVDYLNSTTHPAEFEMYYSV